MLYIAHTLNPVAVKARGSTIFISSSFEPGHRNRISCSSRHRRSCAGRWSLAWEYRNVIHIATLEYCDYVAQSVPRLTLHVTNCMMMSSPKKIIDKSHQYEKYQHHFSRQFMRIPLPQTKNHHPAAIPILWWRDGPAWCPDGRDIRWHPGGSISQRPSFWPASENETRCLTNLRPKKRLLIPQLVKPLSHLWRSSLRSIGI